MDVAHRALNRRERLDLIVERDGHGCTWCGRPFGGHVHPTTDHVVPRVKGGPSWLENEVAACSRCNRSRGHETPAAWLTQCELWGWPADGERIVARLRSLRDRIANEGGQRRARAYVASQLRRLEH